MSNNTPDKGDGGAVDPKASTVTGDLQPAPTDTGWIEVESLRAGAEMKDVVHMTRDTPTENR